MNEIDLSKFLIRTDLITDIIRNINLPSGIESYEEKIEDITINRVTVKEKEASSFLNKKEGDYTTITFNDITDHNNEKRVREVFVKELKKLLEKENIIKDKEQTLYSVLVIGLGNEKSTPDSLGPKVIDEVIATKHIYELVGSLEEGFNIVSKISPGVMGESGIETQEIIESIVKIVKPNFIIVIDALASDSIERVGKTIQMTNTGISPGSGIGNKRKEISKETLNIPVFAIGIPMVVDAVTIVHDTIGYMTKHFSYNLNNNENNPQRLIPKGYQNYLKEPTKELTKKESNYFLGAFGTLKDEDKKLLLKDVLSPIGYNLMVTPKEVDFLIDKLASLISKGINEVLHNKKI